MKSLKIFALATVASVALATPGLAATNLIPDGSFEDGSLSAWTLSQTVTSGQGYTAPVVIQYNQGSSYPTGAFGEAVPTDNAVGNPGLDPVGTYFLYLSSDLGTQTLTTMVHLEAGKSYTFGFDYYLPANGYANPNGATFSASIAGTPIAAFSIGSQPPTTWMSAAGANVISVDTTGDFMFSFSANGYPAKDIAIDRVYLAATDTLPAVPEPASWAMMVVGFGLLGGALRRRRTTLDFA